MEMEKVLIIKLGYSETLDPEISNYCSLGDVLRSTVILHRFKDSHVTWLVDEKAYPLLKGNPYIDNILIYNLTSVLQLQSERFDIVINLEKVPGICALCDSVSAWKRYGFRFDPIKGKTEAYNGSEEIFKTYTNVQSKKQANKFWQEVLYEMIDEKWGGEEYILGYKSTSKVSCDIGLNYKAGSKWPNKAWPMDKWKQLYERLISRKYTVSWQKGLDNIEDYINWINSCSIIITNDSLGLHVAQSLQRYVIALYGPTISDEVYLYNRGEIITPEVKYDCIPCLSPTCNKKPTCMDYISVDRVLNSIQDAMKKVQPCLMPDKD